MPAGDATARLHEAIDLVAGIDVSELLTAEGLGGLLEELTRCTRRLDFEFHRLLRSFEARGDHVPLGYRTAEQWSRDRLRMSDGAAATSLKVGRVLIEMPGVSSRWAAGDLGAEHAGAIASARTEGTREAFGEWEGWLAQQAVDLDMRGLRKVLAKWRLQVDPGCDEPERRERDRDAHVSATFQGAVVIDGIRFFTGKLRRAIQVRDRHCTARGCDRPAEYCDIDHIEPAAAGGRTRPDNGRVACNPTTEPDPADASKVTPTRRPRRPGDAGNRRSARVGRCST